MGRAGFLGVQGHGPGDVGYMGGCRVLGVMWGCRVLGGGVVCPGTMGVFGGERRVLGCWGRGVTWGCKDLGVLGPGPGGVLGPWGCIRGCRVLGVFGHGPGGVLVPWGYMGGAGFCGGVCVCWGHGGIWRVQGSAGGSEAMSEGAGSWGKVLGD